MHNLWVFINRYSTFFLFILFFGGSIVLVVRNNTFQRANAINSSSEIIGSIYQQVDYFKGYLSLNERYGPRGRNCRAHSALLTSYDHDDQDISKIARQTAQRRQ